MGSTGSGSERPLRALTAVVQETRRPCMVLGAAKREAFMNGRHLVLALLDVGKSGIEHVVLFAQEEGELVEVLGSRDVAPFATDYETLQWLLRTVQAWDPPPVR